MSSHTLLLFLISTFLLSAQGNSDRKKILSMGGNDNIGAEVLRSLLETNLYDVTVVTQQAKWLPDYVSSVKSKVNILPCEKAKGDYSHALSRCPGMAELVEKTEQFYAVLDFSSTEARWVHEAIDLLKGKVGVYIYASADSVYDVSQRKKEEDDNKPSREEDAKRPKDSVASQELSLSERHGDAKLGGEEALSKQRSQNSGFPWVSLRLSDLLGLRDSANDKWFLAQLWIQFHHALKVPLYIPKQAIEVEQSLTFTKDVARAVKLVLEKGPETWDTSYNIAMEQSLTVYEVVQRLATLMTEDDIEVEDELDEGKVFQLYPTVLSGPVDVGKAKKALGLQPTTMEEAMKETVEWYEHAFGQMEMQREEMRKKLTTFAVPRGKKNWSVVAEEKGSPIKEEEKGKRSRGETGDDKLEL